MSPSITNRANNTNDNHAMQNIIETKKLQHAIQLLKIELNQRDLLIQNQKIEHEEKCEDLKEKLADMTYQRQLLQTKLDSQLQVKEKLEIILIFDARYFIFRLIVSWHCVHKMRFVNNYHKSWNDNDN